MNLSEQIEKIAKSVVEYSGAYVVEVVIRGERKSKVIELFIDTDDGVTTEHCARVSRELSQVLDTADLISGSYQLVVSSPGLDRPLKFSRQYRKNIGRKISVKCKSEATVEKLTGELLEVSDQNVVLRLNPSGDFRRISFDDIIETYVQSAW